MKAIFTLIVLLTSVQVTVALNMEVVSVGNPGNTADSRYETPGYGSVSGNYNIGKYEVTAGQYTAFLNAVAKTDTFSLYNSYMDTTNSSFGCNIRRAGSSGNYTYSVTSDWANRPVNWVSWGDAARFTNWLSNGQPSGAQNASTTESGSYTLNGAVNSDTLLTVTRGAMATWVIPSENEWYKAAYYNKDSGGYWDYPTCNNAVPGQDLADTSGNNSNYWTAPYVYPIDSGKYTTTVGEFQNSPGPYGTFDQGGNVFEWNETTIFDKHGPFRGLRGGCFNGSYYAMNAINRYSGHYLPTFEAGDVGFRVAQVPEPTSLTLLCLSFLALRRKGK